MLQINGLQLLAIAGLINLKNWLGVSVETLPVLGVALPDDLFWRDVVLHGWFAVAILIFIQPFPNAVNTGYLHSRLLYRLLKEGTSDVDGIVYPSVAHDGSTNIALSPASASSHLAVDVNLLLRVKKKHSYGIYDSEIVRVAVAEDPDGQIVWE